MKNSSKILKNITALLCVLFASSQVLFAQTQIPEPEKKAMNDKIEVAVLGGGCFWCTEAIYQSIEGVLKVESGYSGGNNENPSYEQVSSGSSGHAEVVRITFDPSVLSFAEVLEIFFHTHDPTTLNRQGADSGTQYRSVIFYASEKQKEVAQEVIKKTEQEKLWNDPIVTEVSPLKIFYLAEDNHQNYYRSNGGKPYCSIVIGPKIQKLYKEFAGKIKKTT